jgi:uncharacterized membrane protein YdjX (TVP38/TMEM64 family)
MEHLDRAMAIGALLGVIWGLLFSSIGRLLGDMVEDLISRTSWGIALDQRLEARVRSLRHRDGGS